MRHLPLGLLTFVFVACGLCLLSPDSASAQSRSERAAANLIAVKYRASKESGGALGAPRGAVRRGAHGGRLRLYQNGAIYWARATGAHALHGPILQKYRQAGGSASALGYPVSDVLEMPDGGSEVVFQHGIIKASQTSDALIQPMTWATFSEEGVLISRGQFQPVDDHTAAILEPGSTPVETTVSCGCDSQSMGNCTIVIKRGNNVQCRTGTCRHACIITVVTSTN